jgi:formylglycine-generating enzyme required for sulfatase activity
VAGVYYDYATGSDNLPDGIDFPGDPNFDAVYHDGGSNARPNEVNNVGVPSPFGSFGQAGNVFEWEESAFDLTNDETWEARAIRGNHWYGTYHELESTSRLPIGPTYEWHGDIVGFRVVSVPEPSSTVISVMMLLAVPVYFRHLRRN